MTKADLIDGVSRAVGMTLQDSKIIVDTIFGCFRNLVLLALPYIQQTKWVILYLPHFRTAKAISSSNILKIIGLC